MSRHPLPHPVKVADSRLWLLVGAPAWSKDRPAAPALRTLLDLLDALPSYLPLYCYGTPEWKAAMHDWECPQEEAPPDQPASPVALTAPAPILPGLYRHHKGALYRVLFTSTDSTNGREGTLLVHYLSDAAHGMHTRTAAEFAEPVLWPDGQQRPRFDYVGVKESP